MSSPDEPSDLHTGAPAQAPRAAADPKALRRLADQVHRSITRTFDDWSAGADAGPGGAEPVTPTFDRPMSVPPVRMEQLARTPEPTADLDDLVDVLVPRF